jgi:peptidoglycan/xylan/chitin deacetylase (PgdA/CDA1 family)
MQRTLTDSCQNAVGRFGGFSFGGHHPKGVSVHRPLGGGTTFPNGAKSAILLTFDVEGTYGNGTGDIELEIANYKRICDEIVKCEITGTFNIVGKMVEDHGPDFVEWMLDAGCEVASHGYWHDLNKHYGGDKVYAGHYGLKENREQFERGIDAIHRIRPDVVKGVRIPYGFFNEFTYDAFEQLGVRWTSNVGIDDFVVPGQGFGPAPFQIGVGEKVYPLVEIPLDSQTFDWAIWVADPAANSMFVQAVETYCHSRKVPFDRSPGGAAAIWRQRVADAIATESLFTLLCHPINLAIERFGDAVEDFMSPFINHLSGLQKERKIWVCTCSQLDAFYRKEMSATF